MGGSDHYGRLSTVHWPTSPSLGSRRCHIVYKLWERGHAVAEKAWFFLCPQSVRRYQRVRNVPWFNTRDCSPAKYLLQSDSYVPEIICKWSTLTRCADLKDCAQSADGNIALNAQVMKGTASPMREDLDKLTSINQKTFRAYTARSTGKRDNSLYHTRYSAISKA